MPSREETRAAIRVECEQQGIGLIRQVAYVFATTEHETAGTWEPVREAFWLSEDWRRRNLRYYPYYGRGYTQITWKANYEKFGKLLGVPLVEEPDLAMQPDYARIIMVHGFVHGSFTGKKLADYVNADKCNYVNARRCINGLDKSEHIAGLARKWERELEDTAPEKPT